MEVVSLSPFRVGSLLWQPRPGAWAVTIVCKSTYTLMQGEARLAVEQEYPNDYDNHWNDDEARSLHSPSDLVPFKPRADVMLIGHAFAPSGQPARSVVARLVVGSMEKSIEVFGERTWGPDGRLRDAVKFTRMPLRYERAGGGPETANPVGVRAEPRGTQVANLQRPGATLPDLKPDVEPVGFGPIAPGWPERRRRLGGHATTWSDHDWHKRPLPEDLDPGYFNAAPEDQQLDQLHDDEQMILENLHPEHAQLVTRLPGLRPRAFFELQGGAPHELAMTADTLWIDTDRAVCTLVWRGQVNLDSSRLVGRVLVAMEVPGQRLSWTEVERIAGRATEATGAGEAPHPTNIDPPSKRPTAVGPSRTPQDDQTAVASRPKKAMPTLPFSMDGGAVGTPHTPGAVGTPHTPGAVGVAKPKPTGPVRGPAPDFGTLTHDPDIHPPGDQSPSWLRQSPAISPSAPPPPPAPAAPPPPVAPPPTESPWAAGVKREELKDAGDPAVRTETRTHARPSGFPSSVQPGAERQVAAGAVVAASNAAAVVTPWASAPPAEAQPSVVALSPRATRAPVRDVVELLWFEPAALPRMRETPGFRELVAEPEALPPDDFDFDAEPPPDIPPEVKDRRAVFAILSRGPLTDGEGIAHAISGAVTDEGTFVPPLVMIAGELHFPFDELETLKATVTAVSPLCAGDKKLKDTVEMVNELLKTSWLQGSSGVAEGLTARVKEAFAQSSRMMPASYLESHTDRILLEQRHYQKRTVFGEPTIRSLLLPSGGATPIPTYLPEALWKKLPMFQTLKARLIAEAHVQQDQYETNPCALRVVAVGRLIVTTPRR